MIKGIISSSPEEMREAFYKHLRKLNLSHLMLSWSRNDVLVPNLSLYFLAHRDYVHLKKQGLLPKASLTCVMVTENHQIHDLSESGLWNLTAIISGSEKQRGEYAGDLYHLLTQKKLGKLKESIETPEDNLENLMSLKIQPWLKQKIQSAIFELSTITKTKMAFEYHVEGKLLTIDCLIDMKCPSWEDLSVSLTPLSVLTLDEGSLLRISLGSIIRNVNVCILYPTNCGKTMVSMGFHLVKNQKKFENLPKLIGVLGDI